MVSPEELNKILFHFDEKQVRQRIRRAYNYESWKRKVLGKSGGKCQACGNTIGLQAHHIKSLTSLIVDNLVNQDVKRENDLLNFDNYFDVDNGIALCKNCHLKAHAKDLHDIRIMSAYLPILVKEIEKNISQANLIIESQQRELKEFVTWLIENKRLTVEEIQEYVEVLKRDGCRPNYIG